MVSSISPSTPDEPTPPTGVTPNGGMPNGVMPDGGMIVVGIGASAGGLEASRRLVESIPPNSGLAYILVQHLDPDHSSMMVELLAGHTDLVVLQVAEGMPIQADHLYVIPPGVYMTVEIGKLHLSKPLARQGSRMPFDYLLHSMAAAYGARTACVVLSGTGADGSLGLAAIKARGGLVIVQDPEDSRFDGMPRSAIQTGLADMVLAVQDIPAALLGHFREPSHLLPRELITIDRPANNLDRRLQDILALLRGKSTHDFAQYKEGTLLRRIDRRMGLVQQGAGDVDTYINMLTTDPAEAEKLVQDLLIHVTSFFRNPDVFAMLARLVLPDMVRRQPIGRPLRIWIVGCSTGEEAYSLAILFREAVIADGRNVRLQIFASDVDPESVSTARYGAYPAAIAADVSPQRLARWFTREDNNYQVVPDLRSTVVFSVHDVLNDPPFSRLDFVSCRNMLIYLRPLAQALVISQFQFALRTDGLLLLGNAETIGNNDGRFAEFAPGTQLFRHTGGGRRAGIGTSRGGDPALTAARLEQGRARTRQTSLADLVQRLLIQGFAPAAVLLNRRHECLYTVGPIDRFLRVAPGDPSIDVLAMARHNMQGRLRAALQRAAADKVAVVVSGGHATIGGAPMTFRIAVQPAQHDADELLLVSFVEEAQHSRLPAAQPTEDEANRIAELEQELETTRIELNGALRNLDFAVADQLAVNEEALSVNEELQSSNEELLTSKEELQSLNEELTTLNSEMQEALKVKRIIADDLQNVLNSTNVATILLDLELRIRIFTPSTRALFNVLPGDVGRSLADLNSLAFDSELLGDARAVLLDHLSQEREIETHAGQWFIRRVQPYRTADETIAGVVITFVDATERKHVADALQLAKRQAELANAAKSRFVAAASHDLRQPLQTLALLQGLLANLASGPKVDALVSRLGDTLGGMSEMLNTLLDLNQIEAGMLLAELTEFPVNTLLDRMREEFAYVAHARGLKLRVVPCSLLIHSDPRLLEQLLRNLVSNAVKYTHQGKVLIGCQRVGDRLRIAVMDTGIGIPDDELEAIFEEYHQINNSARERSRGLGLGLSIVAQLGKLLGHKVTVRSQLGHGSNFSVEVPYLTAPSVPQPAPILPAAVVEAPSGGTVMVVEDDPELRDLLELTVIAEGYHALVAADGAEALERVARDKWRPDLLLTDYNMPKGMDGLELATRLRRALRRSLPVIVLTGDTSTRTLRLIIEQDCVHMHKPAKLAEMTGMIRSMLIPATAIAAPILATVPASAQSPATLTAHGSGVARVLVVDDDRSVREALRSVLQEHGIAVEDYASAEAFLAAYQPRPDECLLLDVYLPEMSGLQLVSELRRAGRNLPVVMITGKGDVAVAVQAMKAGALDFVEKPVATAQLLSCLERALTVAHDVGLMATWRETAEHQVATLTPRQREIMDMVLAGHPSKNIAADLGISQRTVENHRASIMKRTETRSLPALARLALAASGQVAATPSTPARTPPPRRS